MGFFDLFTIKEEKIFINSLHESFSKYFPNSSNERLIILSCMSGLLARVAYVDFNIDEKEISHIQKSLTQWMSLSVEEAHFVAQTAITEMKTLSGLDTRKFCTPLLDLLNVDERYQVIVSLFALAASDGEVDNAESNEINYISKSLVLEHKYFIAARAQVKDYLKSLNI